MMTKKWNYNNITLWNEAYLHITEVDGASCSHDFLSLFQIMNYSCRHRLVRESCWFQFDLAKIRAQYYLYLWVGHGVQPNPEHTHTVKHIPVHVHIHVPAAFLPVSYRGGCAHVQCWHSYLSNRSPYCIQRLQQWATWHSDHGVFGTHTCS